MSTKRSGPRLSRRRLLRQGGAGAAVIAASSIGAPRLEEIWG